MVEPVYTPVIALARAMSAGLGLRLTITGADNVPADGGAVLAMNHVSYLDFALCGMAFLPRKRVVRFMAKKEVFDHPVSGPLMRGMKHIPVDREAGAASYLAAVEAARRGEIVGVFPEATISQSFELKGFKSGAARMAMDAGVPLLPMVIWGSQRLMTKGRPRNLTRGTPIRLVIGEPLLPLAGVEPAVVTAELKERMQGLLDQARTSYAGQPHSADDTWWLPTSMGGTAPTPEQADEVDRVERATRAAKRRAARDAAN